MKTGRNDLCPCGSGKKYKKCCFSTDQLREKQRLTAANPSAQPASVPAHSGFFADDEDRDLDDLSNSVIDLLDAGRLDEAEAACHELHRRYPEMIDWLDRTAMVYERRGNRKMAAEYYRRCIQFTLDYPDGFDDDSRRWMRAKVATLDPEGGPAETGGSAGT